MPALRSSSRNAKPTTRSRTASAGSSPADAPSKSYWPIVLIVLAAVLAAVIALLPASIVTHFLPPNVHAEDFSGSLWHGSAAKISVESRDAGALEWHLHPASLLGLAVAADLHWVKIGFVVDGAVNFRRGGFAAHGLAGGGPIEDLRDLGVAVGWHGRAEIALSELSGDFTSSVAAVGDVRVSNLSAAQFADGTDLGSYDLHLPGPGGPAASAGDLDAQLTDTGGPLELKAVIHYAAKERTATLSGTLKERPNASPALRSQIDNLSQMRGRDPRGRVPVEFEFTM